MCLLERVKECKIKEAVLRKINKGLVIFQNWFRPHPVNQPLLICAYIGLFEGRNIQYVQKDS